MRPLIEQMIRAAQQSPGASLLERAQAIALETVWLDTTGLKTNLHFPVDWGCWATRCAP